MDTIFKTFRIALSVKGSPLLVLFTAVFNYALNLASFMVVVYWLARAAKWGLGL